MSGILYNDSSLVTKASSRLAAVNGNKSLSLLLSFHLHVVLATCLPQKLHSSPEVHLGGLPSGFVLSQSKAPRSLHSVACSCLLLLFHCTQGHIYHDCIAELREFAAWIHFAFSPDPRSVTSWVCRPSTTLIAWDRLTIFIGIFIDININIHTDTDRLHIALVYSTELGAQSLALLPVPSSMVI